MISTRFEKNLQLEKWRCHLRRCTRLYSNFLLLGEPLLLPQSSTRVLLTINIFRDDLVKTISKAINAIGLSDLAEAISNAVSKWVLTILQPLLKPLTSTATKALFQSSGAVLSNDSDQFAVFNDGFASDPTHSFLVRSFSLSLIHSFSFRIPVLSVKD